MSCSWVLGRGGRAERRRAAACVTPHMLHGLDGQISQPIPTFSPGGLSSNTAGGRDVSSCGVSVAAVGETLREKDGFTRL